MDLGGLDGLLYITDISWGRISHPGEVLKLDQKLKVVVLDFDDEKKRISLGLKQLTPHPWDILPENIAEGSVVKGKVVNIEDYGAFLEILLVLKDWFTLVKLPGQILQSTQKSSSN